jgi:hypothetical protein
MLLSLVSSPAIHSKWDTGNSLWRVVKSIGGGGGDLVPRFSQAVINYFQTTRKQKSFFLLKITFPLFWKQRNSTRYCENKGLKEEVCCLQQFKICISIEVDGSIVLRYLTYSFFPKVTHWLEKVTVKLSMCLITLWRCVVEWRYSSTILDLGIRWRCVVSFTPRPFYPRRKLPVSIG